MITYVNSENAAKYSALFEEATAALKALGEENGGMKAEAATISTIEQYFYYLPKLIQIGSSNDGYADLRSAGRRYAMLPLDEDHFNIDANKRTISVPSAFSSNGIAVQGDQLAEVVYFKIDRFYDAKDLDDTDIYIQWVNAEGIQGVSAPIVVDIESEANKLIFGWAIPNSVTKKQGSVQFAVRFYKWGSDNKLSFSLATQTTTVRINSTLDFAIDPESIKKIITTDEDNKLFMNRIKSGDTKVTGRESAAEPVYLLDLSEGNDGIVKFEDAYFVDLSDEDNTHVLKVQAMSPDAGFITYSWTEEGVTVGDPGEIVFEEVDTTQPVDNKKVYYVKAEESTEDMPAYKIFKTDGGFPDDPNVKVYEKFATYKIDSIGEYYAIAVNTKDEKNSAKLPSIKVEVPSPSMPTVENNFAVVEDKAKIVEEDKPVELLVSINNDEVNGTKKGTLSYEWQVDHDMNPEAENFVPVEGHDSNLLTLSYDEDPKKVEGFYRVVVKNSKNGVTTVYEDNAAVAYVSYAAEAPELKELPEETLRVAYNNGNFNPLQIEVEEAWLSKWNISGELKYQWFKSANEMAQDDDDVAIEGANEPSFKPVENAQGVYYCVVTNIKNGTQASSVSQLFYLA